MTLSVVVAIVVRVAAIIGVVAVIIGRIRNLRASTKKGGSQNPENPSEP